MDPIYEESYDKIYDELRINYENHEILVYVCMYVCMYLTCSKTHHNYTNNM